MCKNILEIHCLCPLPPSDSISSIEPQVLGSFPWLHKACLAASSGGRSSPAAPEPGLRAAGRPAGRRFEPTRDAHSLLPRQLSGRRLGPATPCLQGTFQNQRELSKQDTMLYNVMFVGREMKAPELSCSAGWTLVPGGRRQALGRGVVGSWGALDVSPPRVSHTRQVILPLPKGPLKWKSRNLSRPPPHAPSLFPTRCARPSPPALLYKRGKKETKLRQTPSSSEHRGDRAGEPVLGGPPLSRAVEQGPRVPQTGGSRPGVHTRSLSSLAPGKFTCTCAVVSREISRSRDRAACRWYSPVTAGVTSDAPQ